MGRILLPLAALLVVVGLYYARRDPQGAARLWQRLRPMALFALAMLYLASPLDVIPDGSAIGVLDDLAVLLAALYFGRGGSGAQEPHRERASADSGARREARQSAAAEADPFAILGIHRGASQEEITKAFRERMKQYHPDRVADLGEDLQKLAHEKAVEIRRAYEALKKR